MKKIIIYLIVLIVLCATTSVHARRELPKPVTPVTKDGIEYSAPLDRMGFVVAKWINTNREIWSKQIYVVKYEYKYGLEEDVQWCFIKSLKLEGNQLIITNEEGSMFSLDIDTLETKTIKGSNVIDHTKHKHPSERN